MTKENIYHIIQSIILKVLPDIDPKEITIQKSLKELGANSIDRLEVLTMAMEALNVKIPLLNFGKAANINELVNIFAANV